MRKNLFNPSDAKLISNRVGRLNADVKAIWGNMTIAEMLHHCNKVTEAILDGKAPSYNSSLKQKLIKFLFLNIIKKFPKNAKAPGKFDVKKRQLIPQDFIEEQQQFLSLVEKFVQHNQPINASHPFFGKLTTNQWGIFAYMHLDHHLRQFGV